MPASPTPRSPRSSASRSPTPAPACTARSPDSGRPAMRRRDALPDPEVVHGLRQLPAALAGEPTADPDLALLVADVRAARPEPSAAFLAAVDARGHAGPPGRAQPAPG